MTKQRFAWLDIARGTAILLVMLLHCSLAARSIGPIPGGVETFNWLLGTVRMPLFFFCSGMLAATSFARPWQSLIERRITPILWIYIVWSALYYVADTIYRVYPFKPEEDVAIPLLLPDGIMWFVYALLLATLIGRVVYAQPKAVQVISVGVVSLLILLWAREFEAPSIFTGVLLFSLGKFVLIAFLAGVLAGGVVKAVIARPNLLYPGLMLAAIGFVGSAILVKLDIRIAAVGLTINGIFLALGLASLVEPIKMIATPLTWVGRRTLEIFVIHQFIIGAVTIVCRGAGLSGAESLPIIYGATVAGALLFAAIARRIGLGPLFTPPALLTRTLTRATAAMSDQSLRAAVRGGIDRADRRRARHLDAGAQDARRAEPQG